MSQEQVGGVNYCEVLDVVCSKLWIKARYAQVDNSLRKCLASARRDCAKAGVSTLDAAAKLIPEAEFAR